MSDLHTTEVPAPYRKKTQKQSWRLPQAWTYLTVSQAMLASLLHKQIQHPQAPSYVQRFQTVILAGSWWESGVELIFQVKILVFCPNLGPRCRRPQASPKSANHALLHQRASSLPSDSPSGSVDISQAPFPYCRWGSHLGNQVDNPGWNPATRVYEAVNEH